MRSSQRRVRRTIILAVLGVVLAALALLPLMTQGFCASTPSSDDRMCFTTAASVLGVQTSWWAWGIGTVILASIGAAIGWMSDWGSSEDEISAA